MVTVFVIATTKPGKKDDVYSRLKSIPYVEPYKLDPGKTVNILIPEFLPEICHCYGSVYDLFVRISTEDEHFIDGILDLHFKKNEDITWFYPLKVVENSLMKIKPQNQ